MRNCYVLDYGIMAHWLQYLSGPLVCLWDLQHLAVVLAASDFHPTCRHKHLLSALLRFLLLGFLPAFFGPPCRARSSSFAPLHPRLNHARNCSNVPLLHATARTCSQILVWRFEQFLSQLKDPPFPCVTQ